MSFSYGDRIVSNSIQKCYDDDAFSMMKDIGL